MKNHLVRVAVGTTLAGLLAVGGAAGAALAETSTPPLSATASTSTPDLSGTADPVRVKLYALQGMQTQVEILDIVHSGQPLQALYDTTTDTYLAAYLDQPAFNPYAVTPRGPGCAVGDACATGSSYYGYYGTGQLSINLTGINRVAAGNLSTTWWKNGGGLFTAAGTTLTLTPARAFDSITRS